MLAFRAGSSDAARLLPPARHPCGAETDMTKSNRLALLLALVLGTSQAYAQDKSSASASANAEAKQTYADIEKTLGSVPAFFKTFPPEGIAGAWAEFKAIQLSDKTALSGKEKELIGLAVAAQIPCHYCVYFHTEAAKANGASEDEIREAIAMSALTRHWSTVLNGTPGDFASFKKEVDTVMQHGKEAAQKAAPPKK